MIYGSVFELFESVAKKYPNNEALVKFDESGFMGTTYRELHERVNKLALSLQEQIQAEEKIGVMLENCPEWVMVDLASAAIGCIVVPIHTTYTWSLIEHILKEAEIKYLFVQDIFLLKFTNELDRLGLKKIVYVGDAKVKLRTPAASFDALLESGGPRKFVASSSMQDSVHTIVYTSGTTGKPKGVMLTHENLLSNVFSATKKIPVYSTDRFFSFLPLAHIFERTAGYYVPILSGAAIYFGRSKETLIDDIKKVQPTIFVSVPRIFERAHEKIIARFTGNALLHRVFKRLERLYTMQKNESLSAFAKFELAFLDMIFFKKIRSLFGGRLRFAVSGGAALGKHIAEFFDSVGILILEGYGLTETSPVVTMNSIESHKFGTVGQKLDTVEVKIEPSGEILVRGLGLMKGYYKQPEITLQAIDNQGWFHTGDIGALDQEHFLTIRGRIKEMIVLSTGRNVFPVPIEQALEESKYIRQAMVYGDNQKAVAALIVPEFENLQQWCREQAIEYVLPDVLGNRTVLDFFMADIKKCLKKFQHFEQVIHFRLLAEEFSQDRGTLSPSLKLKRREILELNELK